jgi:hypothetical protein
MKLGCDLRQRLFLEFSRKKLQRKSNVFELSSLEIRVLAVAGHSTIEGSQFVFSILLVM